VLVATVVFCSLVIFAPVLIGSYVGNPPTALVMERAR